MVMGMENRSPTAVELGTISDLLEDGLRAGALGLSSGLFTRPAPTPSRKK
jgi:N-acyl-D-amino-acid deacylase